MKIFLAAAMMICLAAEARADEPAKAEAKPAAEKKAKPFMAVNMADMKFMAPPEAPKGVMSAPLYGNPQKGMNAGITKIPAGEKHPVHTHSANIRLVIISGTWLQGADEASAKEYTAGAYIYVPGGYKHYSGCKEGAECVFFQENSGPFDMKPVEAAAAAK